MIESRSRGVLDTRMRGYDDWCVGVHLRTTNATPPTSSRPSHSTQDSIPI